MKRRGFTLMETIVAAFLLAVAAVLCAQMLVASAAANRAADWRRLAAREAANVMEQVMALPADGLTPDAVNQIRLSEETTKTLPDARLAIRRDEQSNATPPATQITVEIVWKGHAGEPSPPTRLLAWRFHPEEAKP
jgi:prepilin-type N-terminal cleavage/methylation domain-containing protein